jgi:1,4-alpha-glucan branching enzyme
MGNPWSSNLHETPVPNIDDLLKNDGYLKPYEGEIRRRYGCFKEYLNRIDTHEHGLLKFTESYKTYGLHVDEKTNNVNVLEWAPGAKNLFLRGDFSKK